MKIPVVKEWGSWAVFVSSWLAALAALAAQPVQGGEGHAGITILTIAGLALLINAKNPLASALRNRGKKREPVLWFSAFLLAGLLLLIPFFMEGGKYFAVFTIPVMVYAVLLYKGREHSLLTEFIGFALLTLSAPVVYFTATGELSWRLYAAVLIFFGAAVFKVRARIRKTGTWRWAVVLYCASAGAVYQLLAIPLIMLLPLLENVLSVIRMPEERLRATGYAELIKGVVFVALTGVFWR